MAEAQTTSHKSWETVVIGTKGNANYQRQIEDFLDSHGPRIDGIAGAISSNGTDNNFFLWVRPDRTDSRYKVSAVPYNGPEYARLADDLSAKKVVIIGFNNAPNQHVWVIRPH